MDICRHQHERVVEAINHLPSSQKNTVRHTCAGCAFREGFKEGVRWARERIHERLALPSNDEVEDIIHDIAQNKPVHQDVTAKPER